MKLDYEKSLKLLKLIKQSNHINNLEAEALVHALSQIQDLLDKVYNEILPKIFLQKKLNKKTLSDFYNSLEKEVYQIENHMKSTNMIA